MPGTHRMVNIYVAVLMVEYLKKYSILETPTFGNQPVLPNKYLCTEPFLEKKYTSKLQLLEFVDDKITCVL